MKITRPDFYNDFKCTASKCSDSCCIGWDVYIDEFTEEIYSNIEGEFGEKLRNNISRDSDGDAFFKMTNKRCPFLNRENLCDVFITLGENYLCDICTEHPRFYNTHGEICEEGLGLACEEVCRIVLNHEEPISFVYDENDEESFDDDYVSDLIEQREELIKIAQNRILSISERMDLLMKTTDFPNVHDDKLIDIYKSLESMEDKYGEILSGASDKQIDKISVEEYETDFEHILVYMLYRYFTERENGEGVALAVSFTKTVMLCYKTAKMKNETLSLKDRIDILKCLSKNIEYSDENIDSIITQIG